jgi:hypothetical protein
VRAVSVVRKLSTIEERRQGQICLLRQGDYRNKGHNHEKLASVRVPVNIICVGGKLSTTGTERNKIVCFGEDFTRTDVTNPKIALGSSLDEDVGFRDDKFCVTFIDTYRMKRPTISFRAIKIDKKCKNLSHFSTAQLQAFHWQKYDFDFYLKMSLWSNSVKYSRSIRGVDFKRRSAGLPTCLKIHYTFFFVF